MKKRKQLGPPKSRASFGVSNGVDDEGVPADIIEILRDRARRTIVQKQQLAAKQRRLLETASVGTTSLAPREAPSKESLEDVATTPEKLIALLSRMARS